MGRSETVFPFLMQQKSKFTRNINLLSDSGKELVMEELVDVIVLRD